MGLTLILKGSRAARKRDPVIALVLAGGAVSGGAFKVGGLKALNDFLVGRKISDLDMYVGLSAGALLGASLASGVTPDEMIEVLDGTSKRLDQFKPFDFYHPNTREFIERPAKFLYDLSTYLPSIGVELARALPGLPDAIGPAARRFATHPSYTKFESVVMDLLDHVSPKRSIPALTDHVPSGIFDNSKIERWLRKQLERLEMPNDFRAFQRKRKRSLYITACDLDTAQRAIFGADENSEITISQAVQASSAVPGLYKPARINGVDYVDGGVRHTANIDIAIEKGADLIICYNPFRPFHNRIDSQDSEEARGFADGRYLSDRGMKLILNQVFRTMLHSRLKLGIQRYLNDDRFQGDIVLLEPREHDADFFAMNPMAFWKRNEAVQHGFESVRTTLEQNYDELEAVFGAYGLEMDRATAKRRADETRARLDWGTRVEEADIDDEPTLRVVGRERARAVST